jgi:hypothetical protein
MNMHVLLEGYMHIWLDSYHWTSMNYMSILSRKLQISCHWRSIHAYMLITCVLVDIWASLHRIVWFSTIYSRLRHSLILETIWRIKRIWILLCHWSWGSKVFVSVHILVNHQILVVACHRIIISKWGWCLVLIMSLTMRFIQTFNSQSYLKVLIAVDKFLCGFKLIAHSSWGYSDLKLLQIHI